MRGYRRRGASSYLLGVAASAVLVIQLVGSLVQLPEKAFWGLLTSGTDHTVRRVVEGSAADLAGIRINDEILSFADAPFSNPWERRYAPDGSAVVVLQRPGESAPITLSVAPVPTPRPEIIRQWGFGVIVAAFLLIGLVVFLSRSDLVATLFFLMCLLISRIMLPVPDLHGKGTVFFDRMTITLATVFLPPVFLHFFLNFPVRVRWALHHRWVSWALYAPSVIAGLLVCRFEFDRIILGRPPTSAAHVFESAPALLSVAMIAGGVGLFLREPGASALPCCAAA